MPSFDPYSEWLSIPPEARPPNFYQLLGLKNYESDVDRITEAADKRMGLVKSFANGPYGAISQELLNQISQAKVNLVRTELREAYDAELKLAIEKREALQEPRLADDSDEDVEMGIDDSIEIAIDDSVADEISPLGPSPDEALLPRTATRPAPRIAPRARPQTDTTTKTTSSAPAPDFDIGVEHRPRISRYKRQTKSKQTTNLLITLITTATIATMVMLFIAKGCATDEVANPEPNRGNGGASRTKPAPTQEPKKRPASTVADAIGDMALPPANPPRTPRKPNPIEREPRPSTPANPPTPDPANVDPVNNERPEKRTPARETSDKPQPVNEALGGAIGDIAPPPTDANKPTKPAIPLPADFEARLGSAVRALAKHDYSTFTRHRNWARQAALDSQDAGAIENVDRLNQMFYAGVKLWELVDISRAALKSMTEIESDNGARAAVVESNAKTLVLRVSGQQRRYRAVGWESVTTFPTMSRELTLLLAKRVDPRSAQAEKAIQFMGDLMQANLPSDGADVWKTSCESWNQDKTPPLDFFPPPFSTENNQ